MNATLFVYRRLFGKYTEVKLAYLFGSQARKEATELSDYDFGIYLAPQIDIKLKKEIILSLVAELSSILKTNNVNIVLINDSTSPLLKFKIISEGIMLHQKNPYKSIVESRIYNEYFDFTSFIRRFNS